MATYEERQACTKNCWIMAGVAGLVIAALLYFLASWGAMQALFGGVVCFIILGALFGWIFCSKLEPLDNGRVASADAAARQSTVAGAAAGTAATAAAGVAAASAGASGASASGAAASASNTSDAAAASGAGNTAGADAGNQNAAPNAPTTGSSAAAASDSATASSATAADASGSGSMVKPSKKLAGQDALADQKGSWKYDAPAAEASSDITARSSFVGSADAGADTGSKGGNAAGAKPDAAAPAKAGSGKKSTAKSGGATSKSASGATSAKGTSGAASAKGAAGAKSAKSKAGATSAKSTAGAASAKSADASGGKAKRAPVAKDGKPEMLSAPRASGADDLKLISGVGPKLEGTLNSMGVWHFDQVASWRKKEIAWVDERLRFKGRIERDDWISQAKVLAKGGETEFSRRKKKT